MVPRCCGILMLMGLKIYDEDLVDYSFNVGNHVLRNRDENSIKRAGQFLTTPSIARFMARRLGSVQDGWRILDPAIGSGTLICAMIDNLIAIGKPVEIWVDGFGGAIDFVAVAIGHFDI